MTDLRERPGDQALPTPNREPDIQARVIMDIRDRRELGIQRYGTPLQPHNGRDALRDAYEETVDQAMYLKQLQVERDELWNTDVVRQLVTSALARSAGDSQVDAVMTVIRELMTAIAVGEHERTAGLRHMEIRLHAKLTEARRRLAIHVGIPTAQHSELVRLMETAATVKVTTDTGRVLDWTATISGLADHPTVQLECSDDIRRILPQTFTYTEVPQ